MTLAESIRSLADGRLWRIFLFGVASGYPWIVIGSGMSAWLKDEGLSRGSIGLFGVVFLAYTFNFLWAPIVDHLKLPLLSRLGQRRSWIFLCQILLVLLIVALSLNDPSQNLLLTAAVALGVSIFSATQDLSIDAYRITIIREDEPDLIGMGASMTTAGWWTGFSLPAVFAFWLADDLGWPLVYQGLAILFLLIAVLALGIVREPARPAPEARALRAGLAEKTFSWVDRTYIDAVAEFFRRNGALLAFGILGFIFFFKIGEAFLGRMAIVFYKEVGFTTAEIGTYSKGIGWIVSIVCALAAGLMTAQLGNIRMLFAAGIAMAATNLLFSWIAIVGPDTDLFAIAVVLDGIAGAVSTVAFVAFISEYTSRFHSATQYAALASVGNSGRTLLAAGSGFMVTALGGDWALFFVITALMVTPSLCILWWIWARIRHAP